MKKAVRQQNKNNMNYKSGKVSKGSGTNSGSKTFSQPKSSRWPGILVLILAAAVFFGAYWWVHTKEVTSDGTHSLAPFSDDALEFETAKVTEITDEETKITDEFAEGALSGSQELSVVVESGRYKGESMTVYNFFGPLTGVPVSAGDKITITIKNYEDGHTYATVYEVNRIPVLAFFIILFFIVILLVGGFKGLKSLIGLIITFICLFAILIPLILKGAPSILTTFLVCTYIALVCFTILGGVHRKTISAFLGTVSGTALAMIFGLLIQHFAKIDGLRLEDAEALLQMKYIGFTIGVRGLLVAGIIISALGAVMDVAMSISSALEEVHAANPNLSRRELIRSGMNVGRDMAGTMTNTLLLAFLGSEFSLMIFFIARDLTFYHLFSTAFIALETISGISASIGMILAIPLTVLISSVLITRK